ncbi:MAG: CoA pyrophosphatase [Megasphaera sp.]|nr:CoA pyrophosphatase [Megasphaera sp.]MCI1247770.1 CoA pyrophosphatase [Megasphaera sp.]
MNHKPWPDRIVRQNTCMNTAQTAVLVPVVMVDGEEHLLFEVRSSRLSWQPGDICFPGGGIEKTDASSLDAALRETWEEIGVPASQIHVLAPLDYMESPVGVTVWPFAAFVEADSFTINTDEITEIFTVPVDWFISREPEIHQIEMATRPAKGFPADMMLSKQQGWKKRRTYDVLLYRYGNRIIWGITAHIIANFLQIRGQINDL